MSAQAATAARRSAGAGAAARSAFTGWIEANLGGDEPGPDEILMEAYERG